MQSIFNNCICQEIVKGPPPKRLGPRKTYLLKLRLKEVCPKKAAKQCNIPFTTLRDRQKNQNMSNPRLGRKPVCTQQQETEIAEQVAGFAILNVADLRKLVYKYTELNNITNNFDQSGKTAGLDWVHAFMRRNPSFSIRKAEATGLNRISAFNKEEITHFYNKLDDLMEKHKFIPNNIYNADETGITTVTDPG
ncbi:unnamed protein product [Colias eurytheme]|nr:unnamed protein product [Colias eurytheme]